MIPVLGKIYGYETHLRTIYLDSSDLVCDENKLNDIICFVVNRSET